MRNAALPASLATAGAAIVTLLAFDDALFAVVNGAEYGPHLDTMLEYASDTRTLRPWAFAALVAAATAGTPRTRATLLLASLAVALCDPLNHYVLKELAARPRPCSVLEGVVLRAGRCPTSLGLPSSHVANTSALALVVAIRHRPAALLALSLIGLVGWSRVHAGVHRPADVVAGLGVGLLIARATCGLGRRFEIDAWVARFGEGLRRSASRWFARGGEARWTTLYVLGVVLLLAHNLVTIATTPLDLVPDEAHYWEWSRRLDLSYYSKGPGIAYLISLSTWLAGETPFGVRLGAVVCATATALGVFELGRRLTGSTRSAAVGGFALALAPVFTAGSLLATIDGPYVLCWTLTLLALHRALHERSNRAWAIAGTLTGIGFLFKYTMALIGPCALAMILATPGVRGALRTRGPYLAVAIALIWTLPVWIWNATNDWITFAHVATLAGASETAWLRPLHALEFVGSQLGILTPWVLGLALVGIREAYREWRCAGSLPGALVFWCSAPVLGFFLLKSLQAKVQPNWPIVAYVPGVLYGAHWLCLALDGATAVARRGSRRLISLLAATSIALSLGLAHPTALAWMFPDLPVALDPARRLKGWRALGEHAGLRLAAWRDEGASPVPMSQAYTNVSELAFYLPGQPRVYSVRVDRRHDQYDIWADAGRLPVGSDVLFVTGGGPLPDGVAPAFDHCLEDHPYRYATSGGPIRSARLYRCEGWRALPRPTRNHY